MGQESAHVLTINGGSSSIRFALHDLGRGLQRGFHGKVERIGQPEAELEFADPDARRGGEHAFRGRGSVVPAFMEWLGGQQVLGSVVAVGHRVVHGMEHENPELVTPALLDELRRIVPQDPEHLRLEIELMEAFQSRYGGLRQVACFDTSFHRQMPRVARMLPIPRRFASAGILRYGFHGLSYSYLLEELARVAGPAAANGRVILAHLGNGASLAAVRDGVGVDTTMGFTPTGGLVMGSRSGDLDPGVLLALMRTYDMSPAAVSELVNHHSGLLGLSETSSDMRDLLTRQTTDERAGEAIETFCYQTRKWVGSFAAALGGLDTLVFAGGIGENCAEVRAAICSGLEFLGVRLDEAHNCASRAVISSAGSGVTVRVMGTDEAAMIARLVTRTLGLGSGNGDAHGVNHTPEIVH